MAGKTTSVQNETTQARPSLGTVEAKRALSVAAFLDDLGVDSPVLAPKTLSSTVVESTSSSMPKAPKPLTAAPRPKTARPIGGKRNVGLSPMAEESPQGSSIASKFKHAKSIPIYSDENPPSPFLSAQGSAQTEAPPLASNRAALAGLLAVRPSPDRGVTTVSVEAESKGAAAAVAAAKARAREAARAKVSSQSISRTAQALSASVTVSSRRHADENQAPVIRRSRVEERPSVF